MAAAPLTVAPRASTPRVETIRPVHRPDELWHRCPVCEPSWEPIRWALTEHADGRLECRNDCSIETIRRALGSSAARIHRERTSQANRERTSRTNTESTSLSSVRDDVLSLSDGAPAAVSRLPERPSATHRLPLYGTNREAVERILLALCIEDCWHDFPCLLDDHDGTAAVFLDKRKDDPSARAAYKYACRCNRQQPIFCTLAELREALARHTDPRLLNGQLAATWWARLAYEAGLLEPEPVRLTNVAVLQESHRPVAQGFALLVGLRYLTHPDTAVAFTRDFAAAWCAVPESRAYAAICAMKAQHILIEAGRDGRTPLYLPGVVHREAIDNRARQRCPQPAREAA